MKRLFAGLLVLMFIFTLGMNFAYAGGAENCAVYGKNNGSAWKRLDLTGSTHYSGSVQKGNQSTNQGAKSLYSRYRVSGIGNQQIPQKTETTQTVKLKSLKPVGTGKITLEWEKTAGAFHYHVHRKQDGKNWECVALVADTSYTEAVSYDVKYTYTVLADLGDKITAQSQQGLSIVRKKSDDVKEIDPSKPMIALTYDDGPGKYTGKILDALEKYDAKATFFVVGKNVAGNAATVKRAYNMGCEIGNHSYYHDYLTKMSASKLKEDLQRTDAAIRSVTGETPKLMRPPYGSYKTNTVRNNVGKPIIMWNIDTRDWETRSASKTLASVKRSARDGSIILMHDIHKSTCDAAESIIKYLTEQGYQLVTVSELAYYKGVTMEAGKNYGSFR